MTVMFIFQDEGLDGDETSWRRAVERQSYVERILELLVGLGSNLEILIRITPATKYLSNGSSRIHPAQQRIDNYFRDEIINSKMNLRYKILWALVLAQRSGLVARCSRTSEKVGEVGFYIKSLGQ